MWGWEYGYHGVCGRWGDGDGDADDGLGRRGCGWVRRCKEETDACEEYEFDGGFVVVAFSCSWRRWWWSGLDTVTFECSVWGGVNWRRTFRQFRIRMDTGT